MNMRTERLFESRRQFQLWRYVVSHGQLLLRSNPSSRHKSRIEVLFKGVEWLNLPTTLNGLAIYTASSDEQKQFEAATHININGGLIPYIVKSKGTTSFVLANGCWSVEEQKDYFATSSLLIEGLK